MTPAKNQTSHNNSAAIPLNQGELGFVVSEAEQKRLEVPGCSAFGMKTKTCFKLQAALRRLCRRHMAVEKPGKAWVALVTQHSTFVQVALSVA